MINIYVANLAKYNEGILKGEWIELPCVDLDERIAEILGNDEECAIHDYESDVEGLRIGEYSNVYKLNELAERLDGMQAWELEELNALTEVCSDIEEALETYHDSNYTVLHSVNNDYDLGYEYMEMTGDLTNMSEFAQRYFDYESLGRDLGFNGWHITDNGLAICRS